MISVNSREFEWRKGMTMAEAIRGYQTEHGNISGYACIYLKNNSSVENPEKEFLCDGDKLSVFPILSGG